jgi:hypothetical protein
LKLTHYLLNNRKWTPQIIRIRVKLKLSPALRVDAKEMYGTAVEVAEGIDVVTVVTVVVDEPWVGLVFVEGTDEDAPLDGSPTKNILPPIGCLRPTVFTNSVILKFVRLVGTGMFWIERFAGWA